jgi:alginate O-acetyltransferase complex protein AlgI
LAATATTLCGIALLLRLPRVMASSHPWLAGYVAIAALLLTIHFGFFKLLSLLWRHAGWHAAPMMLAPWLSRSLADFWSNRWNLAFRDLTHTYLFRPLVRPLGIAGANLASFILSGLVHELVISLPAGAGFGLPTLYFTIQGLATLIERRLCLPEMLMRVVAIAVVVGPAPLLFHPPFVANVVLPLLRAIRVI